MLNISKFDKLLSFLFVWYLENIYFCISKIDKLIIKNDKLMSKKTISQWAKKNLVGTIIVGVVISFLVWMYVREINAMNNAATSYDYCYHLCKLFEHNSKTIFFMLYGIMYYRTYSSKQYSKWSLWLFYITAIVMLVHFIAAEQVFEYVFFHIGEHKYKLPSLASDIYGTPAFFIILSFFFMPKLIKDTLKLKQEQELTI